MAALAAVTLAFSALIWFACTVAFDCNPVIAKFAAAMLALTADKLETVAVDILVPSAKLIQRTVPMLPPI